MRIRGHMKSLPVAVRRLLWSIAILALLVGAGMLGYWIVRRPLPVVGIDDVRPPARESMVVVAMGWGTIAWQSYGCMELDEVLARFHHLPMHTVIPDGTVIRTPSLPRLFQKAGLDPRYQPMINVLAKALQDYLAMLPEDLRASPDGHLLAGYHLNHGRSDPPADFRKRMVQLANQVDIACRWIERGVDEPQVLPRHALRRFREAAALLRRNGPGRVGSPDYDTFGIRTGFSAGFANLLVWVQENYR